MEVMSRFNAPPHPQPFSLREKGAITNVGTCSSPSPLRGEADTDQGPVDLGPAERARLLQARPGREQAGVRGKITKQLSKNLRRNQPDAERKMWRHLKNRALTGFKFRRQCPIGPYIVDFVCFEKMLVVEIDGGQHAIQIQKDARRTEQLESRGFRVIRFWNNEVLANTESVLNTILTALLSSPPSPAVPAGVREHPAHPFDGADVHGTSATTPSHLPLGEGSNAENGPYSELTLSLEGEGQGEGASYT